LDMKFTCRSTTLQIIIQIPHCDVYANEIACKSRIKEGRIELSF
jgi:hypothetical protein